MSTRLQQARTARGWSQGRLALELERRATALHLSVATRASLKPLISRWENGHSTPDEHYRRLLRDAFGLTDGELGFPGPTAAAAPNDDHGLSEIQARLASSLAVDGALVALLQQQTDHLRLLDRRLGAPTLLNHMRAHIATVEQLLIHATTSKQRAPLAGVLADAASLAGWQALDVGGVQQAWQHYQTARTAAREAENPSLLAHALGEQAFALLDLRQPRQAVDLLDEAASVSKGRVPRLLQAWLEAAQAEALAAVGDLTSSRRAFDSAWRLLPEDSTDPYVPYIALDPAHLSRWQGNVLTRLADPSAVECLVVALQTMPEGFVRARAALHCDLVAGLLLLGEQDRATDHARQAGHLAAQAGSVRQRKRVEALRLAA